MIKVMLNESNNRIFGYMYIDENTQIDRDDIIIKDENDINLLITSNLMTDRLYFIDNHVTTKNINDVFSDKIESINSEIDTLKNRQNADTLFSLVMNGKSMDEAISIMQKETNTLKEKKEMLLKIIDEQEQARRSYWANIMNKEEENKNYKYYISIVLIVRDENEYIEEWLNHHLGVLGVDHIYLYDNESKIPIKEYLESSGNKYLNKITFIYWADTKSNQEDSLNHFLKNYGDETKWMITIDIDEFIIINNSKKLHDILNEYEDKPYILSQWIHYNANGIVEKTNESVVEKFIQRAENLDVMGQGKFFVQTGKCSGFVGRIHIPRKYCELYVNEQYNLDMFQTNHYITKSFEEWNEKMKKGSISPIYGRNYSLFFDANPDMKYLNTEENYRQDYGANIDTQIE